MGMTIDEAIRRINDHNYIHHWKEPRAIYISEVFDVAIDTMHKYQKIEKIINAPIGGTSAKYNAIVNLIKYSEVDDGNVD